MRHSFRLLGSSIFLVVFIYYIFNSRLPTSIPDPVDNRITNTEQKHHDKIPEISTVVASQSTDNTTWLLANFPSWKHEIYVTNDPDATLTVPVNKGREGMVYLTYIIDNYTSLPDIVLFLHANRYQWHNDDPLFDGARSLSRIQFSHIREQGYVNLRCAWSLGCPSEIRPLEAKQKIDSVESDARAAACYADVFEQLFPGVDVPEHVGVSCCAQFAVTREKILQRPRSDYERIRQWLLETDLEDGTSGRILEYSWHSMVLDSFRLEKHADSGLAVLFGQEAVHCPNAAVCYCKVFGLCNLFCEENSSCREQYQLPKFSTLPEGWPWYGWDGEWQNATAM